jgi:hypothetical protein
LLAIEPNDLICLPAGTRLRLTCNVGLQIAADTTMIAWPTLPLASGESLDISLVGDRSEPYALKLFAENVPHGEIEIVNRGRTEALCLSSKTNRVSQIGLWLNYGAWSGASAAPYYNAGIEPTTFPADDLNVAASHATAAQLAPSSNQQWAFSVSFRRP